LYGHFPLEIVARVAAVAGDSDRAIPALQKLLSVSYASAVGGETPLTPALLRLDSMFDPIRNDPRFEKLASGAERMKYSLRSQPSRIPPPCPERLRRKLSLRSPMSFSSTLSVIPSL